MAVFPDSLTVYRVRQSTTHPNRWVRKAWYGRTWQAEWEGTLWCPRGYTENGARRKALRWQRRGWPTPSMVARRRRLRSLVRSR